MALIEETVWRAGIYFVRQGYSTILQLPGVARRRRVEKINLPYSKKTRRMLVPGEIQRRDRIMAAAVETL